MKQDREYVWISSTRLLPSWLQLSFRSSWELWQRLSPTLHQCAERGCTTSSCGSRTTTGEHFLLPFSSTMSFFYFLLAIYNIFPNQSGLNPDTITMYHYFYSFYVSNRASTVGKNQSHIDSLKSWFRMLFISYIFRIANHGLAAALTAACTVLILLIWLYCFVVISFSDEESKKDNVSLEVLNAAKETLLQGLSDENQGLQ